MRNNFNSFPNVILIKDYSKTQLKKRIEEKERLGWVCVGKIEEIKIDRRPVSVFKYRKGLSVDRDRRCKDIKTIYQVCMKR